MSHKIKENAIFIADSHYSEKAKELQFLLKELISSKKEIEQIIFMGDMFEFIEGNSKFFININSEVVELINKLSLKTSIIYLEGNHDYNLENIFPNVEVIARENQPLIASYNGKSVALAHGDIYVNDKLYDIYCKIIRDKTLLKCLNFLDINSFISKKIYESLLKKNICTKIKDFKKIVERRLLCYNYDIIIEGHFHQGEEHLIANKLYKNIPSLYCSKEYVILKNSEFIGVKICQVC